MMLYVVYVDVAMRTQQGLLWLGVCETNTASTSGSQTCVTDPDGHGNSQGGVPSRRPYSAAAAYAL